MMDNNLYSLEASQAGERMIEKIKNGKIRNHKLVYSSPVHFGDIERNEKANYQQFIRCKNFYTLMEWKGESYYE